MTHNIKLLAPNEELSLAIKIASDVHHGQLDKGGNPYILHPLFIMNQFLYDLQLATIAVLHDVIEDSKGTVTIQSLREMGFSDRVLTALSLLTHTPDFDYIEKHGKDAEYLDIYIPAICTNFDAVLVKRKDNDHNSRITRLKLSNKTSSVITASMTRRLEKYAKSYLVLGEAKRRFQRQLKSHIN